MARPRGEGRSRRAQGTRARRRLPSERPRPSTVECRAAASASSASSHAAKSVSRSSLGRRCRTAVSSGQRGQTRVADDLRAGRGQPASARRVSRIASAAVAAAHAAESVEQQPRERLERRADSGRARERHVTASAARCATRVSSSRSRRDLPTPGRATTSQRSTPPASARATAPSSAPSSASRPSVGARNAPIASSRDGSERRPPTRRASVGSALPFSCSGIGGSSSTVSATARPSSGRRGLGRAERQSAAAPQY